MEGDPLNYTIIIHPDDEVMSTSSITDCIKWSIYCFAIVAIFVICICIFIYFIIYNGV